MLVLNLKGEIVQASRRHVQNVYCHFTAFYIDLDLGFKGYKSYELKLPILRGFVFRGPIGDMCVCPYIYNIFIVVDPSIFI